MSKDCSRVVEAAISTSMLAAWFSCVLKFRKPFGVRIQEMRHCDGAPPFVRVAREGGLDCVAPWVPRGVLAYDGLTLDGDERLLAGALEGSASRVQLAEAICSARRMGLSEAPATHSGCGPLR